MNFKATIIELCPHCNEEVELEDKYETQICPSCGTRIQPCSICEHMICGNCPLE